MDGGPLNPGGLSGIHADAMPSPHKRGGLSVKDAPPSPLQEAVCERRQPSPLQEAVCLRKDAPPSPLQ